MSTNIVVHGHFYQPPRENPSTGTIDAQPDAAPFHDWNERVHAESYRPNTRASIFDGEQGRVVNNFEKLSFNVGPTLLAWMQDADRETYDAILEADRRASERTGHGNAIAQAFHHSILPLAPRRDVRTEIRWGLTDFEHRFGRRSHGLWLPETAASNDVLDVLIEEEVGFTILSPHQAALWRESNEGWIRREQHPLDTGVGHLYRHSDGSGRSLALFFYDADIARAIAFERAGSSAERFLDLFTSRSIADDRLVHTATDGETYGHHHKFSELGLAYALFVEAERRDMIVTNYSNWLESHPPTREARLVDKGSSWSCAHGVERWRGDCGCHTGGEEGWTQAWRGPLRRAFELVRDAADALFEEAGHEELGDPWGARDRYVRVVIGSQEPAEFLEAEGARDHERAAQLLDLQRNNLAMFTSCGWFFNDCGGIETQQVLHYAARALQLIQELGAQAPLGDFVNALARARSNDPAIGSAADIFFSLAARGLREEF